MSERLKLTDREWRAFRIKDLFTLSTGAIVPREQLAPGRMPRITATEQNNGVDAFTASLEGKAFRTNADCLSVSFLGSVFYQSNASSFDMKIHSLNLKDKALGRHVGLFVATELRKQFAKFSYGNQLSSSDLPHQKFQLPSSAGAPDWEFMSAYMQQEEKALLKEAIPRLERQLAENHAVPVAFKDREWRAFFIEDLFDRIERGKRLVIKDRITGETPFITAGETNNGVSGFIGNESHKTHSEAVTLDMFANAFYQGWPFMCDDNITVLKLRGQSKYVHMFLLPVFSKLKEKYSYAKQVRPHRLSREIIQLPVTPAGAPDWEFMSAYMQGVEREMLRGALAYFKGEL